MATFEYKIVIVPTLFGLVIGRMSEGLLDRPRILIIKDGKDKGQTQVGFKQLIGDPEIFNLGGFPYYWSENSELNELYNETVSPIKIVK